MTLKLTLPASGALIPVVISSDTSGTNYNYDLGAAFASIGVIGGALIAVNNLSDLASAATARTNLGLGSAATQASTVFLASASNLSDLANAGTARTNLGLGTISTQAASSVTITGGSVTGITDLAIADGGTGASTATAARTNLDAACRTPQIQSVSSSATVTPTFADDQVIITAQAAALNLANPTGTALDGWGIAVRIKDNATARAITYGTQYRAIGVTLPTTTVISKTLYLGMVFNSADTKWDVVAVAQEA